MFTRGRLPLRGVVPESEISARPGVERFAETFQSPGRPAPLTLCAVRMTEFQRTSRSTEVKPSAGAALTGTVATVPLLPPASSGMLIVDWVVTTSTCPLDGVEGICPSFRSCCVQVRADVPGDPDAWKT